MTQTSEPMGPLVVHPENPRYFMNAATGRAVYLTGSHTWANLQERALPETRPFDFSEYLRFLRGHGHNFVRLWHWEHAAWMQFTERMIAYAPNAYMRQGPGRALDGKPKFDLDRYSKGYFDRLRERALAAGKRGIYVSVMLFQGFSIEKKGGADDDCGNPWHAHPFHKENNINGINGDPLESGQGREVHTLAIKPILARQEDYVRHVLDVVADLDNVLIEISNESHGEATDWQYHMIELVHRIQAGRPIQHPVGMTFQHCHRTPGTNAELFESPAEWISPNPEAPGGYDYRYNPPPADGAKVIVNDTDHLWGMADPAEAEQVRKWTWKCLLRGLNPIFMDPYRDARTGPNIAPAWDPVREAMGRTLAWARRLSLPRMVPLTDLSSTGYCLADPGAEYAIYQPEGGPFTARLPAGRYQAVWYHCVSGREQPPKRVRAPGGPARLDPPFAGDVLLHLTSLA